jgi:uridine phosphorylase
MAREIPLFYGSPKDRALFGPEDFLGWYGKKIGFKKTDIAIIFFSHGFYAIVGKKFKARKTSWYDNRVHASTTKINGKKISLICFQGIGASNAVTFVEELIILGAKKIIFVGGAGCIQKKASVGDLVLPVKAIRDEGTSYHYLKPGKYAFADKSLAKLLEKILKKQGIKYFKGATWTTDAPYRETVRKLKKYSKEGVLTVEMEASALFALGTYRKVKIAGLFYISDLLHEKWKPAFGSKETIKAKEKIASVLLETVRSLR